MFYCRFVNRYRDSLLLRAQLKSPMPYWNPRSVQFPDHFLPNQKFEPFPLLSHSECAMDYMELRHTGSHYAFDLCRALQFFHPRRLGRALITCRLAKYNSPGRHGYSERWQKGFPQHVFLLFAWHFLSEIDNRKKP